MRVFRRRRLFVPLGVLLLLALLLASVPARLLPGFLPGDALSLAGVSGSLWRGRAARAVLQTPNGYFHLGELHWRVRFLSLVTLAPTVELSSEWGSQRVATVARVRGQEIRFRKLDASLSAALARHWAPVDLGGQINFLFDELRLTEGALREARGRVVWQDASWQSGGTMGVLGTYLARFDPVATAASPPADAQDFRTENVVTIETLEGPVLATGQVYLGDRRYRIELDVRPAAAAAEATLDPALVQGLSLFATPSENGYLLRLNGEFGQSR